MPGATLLGTYVDEMVVMGEQYLHRAPLSQRTHLSAAINARKQMLMGGVRKAMHEQANLCARLHQYDPLLQLRWDHDETCWVVDRQMPEGFHAIILLWKNNSGALQIGDGGAMMECLAQCDIQRQYATPEDYVRAKRAEAEAIRKKNEEDAANKVLEAVDSLSTRQLQNFVDVERAIQTGEKVVAHGSDERKLDKWHARTKQKIAEGKEDELIPLGDGSMNPGMNPQRYNRKHKHRR